MEDIIHNILYLNNKYAMCDKNITNIRGKGKPRRYIQYNNYKGVKSHSMVVKDGKMYLRITAINKNDKKKILFYNSRRCYDHEILIYMFHNRLRKYIPRQLYSAYKNNLCILI